MPSSDPITIPKVLKIVQSLNPLSILDVGAGNGRYGFLFREILDWNYGRLSKDMWLHKIDALEVDSEYITPVHSYVYDNVIVGDFSSIDINRYDLIFMGDVLEHFPDWEYALNKAVQHSGATIVVAPNWKGSIAQNDWHGHKHESHLVELSPSMVGGKCVFANSKCFISALYTSSEYGNIIEHRELI